MKRRSDKRDIEVERETPEELMKEEEDDFSDENNPPTIDPYKVLGLETEATVDDVKKAYRKMALKYHPDKAAEADKQAANKRFQEIAFAYAVLSDDRRRKRYDLTGSTAESLEDDDDFDWLKFYREQFENVVNEDAINKLSDEYKGSDEERRDLLKAYTKFKGSLAGIYNVVMLSDILVDDDRFRQILDDAISKGEIESFPAYAKETDLTRQKAKDSERKSREAFDKREAAKEAKAATANGRKGDKAKSKKGSGDMADLAALIQARQKSRAGGFFDHLETKYAPKPRGSKRATPMEEPLEESFQEMADRAKKRKQNSRTKKVAVNDGEDEEMGFEEEDIGDSVEEDDEEDEIPRKPKARAKAHKGRGRVSSKGL